MIEEQVGVCGRCGEERPIGGLSWVDWPGGWRCDACRTVAMSPLITMQAMSSALYDVTAGTGGLNEMLRATELQFGVRLLSRLPLTFLPTDL